MTCDVAILTKQKGIHWSTKANEIENGCAAKKDPSEAPVGFKETLPPHPIETRENLLDFILNYTPNKHISEERKYHK